MMPSNPHSKIHGPRPSMLPGFIGLFDLAMNEKRAAFEFLISLRATNFSARHYLGKAGVSIERLQDIPQFVFIQPP